MVAVRKPRTNQRTPARKPRAILPDALAKYGEIVKFNEVKDSKDIKKAAQAAEEAITAWSALQKSYTDKGPGVYANFKGWANTIGGINNKLSEIKTALDAGDSEKAARTCLDVEDFILAMDKDLQIVTTADKVIEMRRLLLDLKEKQGDEKKLVVTQMNDLAAKLSDTGLPKPTTRLGQGGDPQATGGFHRGCRTQIRRSWR